MTDKRMIPLYVEMARQRVRYDTLTANLSKGSQDTAWKVKQRLENALCGISAHMEWADSVGSKKDMWNGRFVLRYSQQVYGSSGYYCRTEHFRIIVFPDLAFGFDLRIQGGTQSLKEQVHQMLDHALRAEVEEGSLCPF